MWKLGKIGKITAATLLATSLLQGVPLAVGSAASTPALDRLCDDYLGGWITVEALGDSIVWGSGASSEGRRWVNRVGKVLETNGGALWVGAMPGGTVVDYLPGGQHHAHTQFTRDVKPTLVLWNWRVNDQYTWEHNLPHGSSPAQLRDRYVQLATHIRQASPTTTIMIVNSPRIIAPGWGTAVETQYIQAMWEAKTLIPSALWLDLALYSPTTEAGNDAGLMHPDGIHQGDAGHAMTAAAVHQRIHATCTR